MNLKLKDIKGLLLNKKIIPVHNGNTEHQQKVGYNKCIEEQGERAVSVDRKSLAKVVQKAGQDWEKLDDPIRPLYVYIADEIHDNLKSILVWEGEK